MKKYPDVIVPKKMKCPKYGGDFQTDNDTPLENPDSVGYISDENIKLVTRYFTRIYIYIY